MKYFCNIKHLATITAVIGLVLIVLMVYIGIISDFTPLEQLLDIVITGQVAGLVFLVASDLMHKTLKLQARIAALEQQVARLTPAK